MISTSLKCDLQIYVIPVSISFLTETDDIVWLIVF